MKNEKKVYYTTENKSVKIPPLTTIIHNFLQ
ncbi:hypothetical protein SAMN06265171_112127 [Chryseobacterium rhizoplanae]|uniref:Uncharacterized protein n=1 Tax=Chryseobacterium rhizoplanae TaxID=1609531 RepID=A0A521F938_9FLAO|nr:hypothetical protein SAMN06265171_112127 [Chryseobacterium rhizoplanae]